MEWKSRKKLLARIDELERELYVLKDIERINTVIKKHDLPKCESNLCESCVHCVTRTIGSYWNVILGCSKNIDCKDYVPNPLTVLNYQKFRQG